MAAALSHAWGPPPFAHLIPLFLQPYIRLEHISLRCHWHLRHMCGVLCHLHYWIGSTCHSHANQVVDTNSRNRSTQTRIFVMVAPSKRCSLNNGKQKTNQRIPIHPHSSIRSFNSTDTHSAPPLRSTFVGFLSSFPLYATRTLVPTRASTHRRRGSLRTEESMTLPHRCLSLVQRLSTCRRWRSA
jgi:hypothetical protein